MHLKNDDVTVQPALNLAYGNFYVWILGILSLGYSYAEVQGRQGHRSDKFENMIFCWVIPIAAKIMIGIYGMQPIIIRAVSIPLEMS